MESSSRDELRRRFRQQEVVAELGQQALETDDLDRLLADATRAVSETLDVEYAKVLELLPGGDRMLLREGVGWRDGLVGSATVPTDLDSQAGYTLISAAPIIVDDLTTETRFSGPELLIAHGVTSGISVIIGSVEEPWGVLGAHTTTRQEFTRHDATFVQSVANVLAAAIENDRTQRELTEIYGRITDAFYALDAEWRFTHINDRATELIDFSGDGLVGKRVWEEFEWAADSKLREEYEQAMATQDATSFELYYPDPLDAWFEIHAYPSTSGLSVYFRDVTDRKERERELELFRTLLDHSNDSVLVIDPETGQFIDANDTACQRRGYSREELLGRSVPDLQTAIPDQEAWNAYVSKLKSEGELTFEGRHKRADGSSFPVEISDSYVEVDREYVLAIARDATERRERKRELERSNERLEQFAYAASHDLQEPLRMVSSYLQLIDRRYGDELDADGEEFLAFAIDGADRMREMIDGLLAYSRIDTQRVQFEPVDLDEVVDNVRDNLQLTIDDADADITSEPLPRVRGDESQLEQLFQNLLSNAIEYAGEAPPRVHLEADRIGTKWRISVRDEGIGIEPADQDRVFEVFKRLHSHDEHAGTGIGLALCRRIVERHGGEISIESTRGEGTTVSVTLPGVKDASRNSH